MLRHKLACKHEMESTDILQGKLQSSVQGPLLADYAVLGVLTRYDLFTELAKERLHWVLGSCNRTHEVSCHNQARPKPETRSLPQRFKAWDLGLRVQG